jgi:glycosyltransferase involved in cell wall biosynthesis
MLISVVMATYNDKPEELDASLRSVVDQSWKDWELVVCDDSSHAGSTAVLEKYALALGPRMRYLHNPSRLGLVGSLNRALTAAKGGLIARMDGDDLCCPERLAHQAAYLELHPEVGILGGDIRIISESGAVLSVRRYRKGRDEILKMSFIRNPLAQPTVMLRRSVLDEIGLYDPRFSKAEDYELWLRALKRGIVVENLDEVLISYRVPGDYSRKRDSSNWKFSIKAKLMHFRHDMPLRSCLGILVSLALLLAPAGLLDALYARDHRAPILYR